MTWNRRQVARLLLGAPLATAPLGALLGGRVRAADETAPRPDDGAAAPPPSETPLGKFLAKDAGLKRSERDRVVKDVAGLERGLETVRAFPLGNDVVPAGTFRALRSKRRSRA